VRQAEEAVSLATQDAERGKKIIEHVLLELSKSDWSESPPAIARHLHRIIRRESGVKDPYRGIKARMNEAALQAVPSIIEGIANADHPEEAAIRVALAGNLLDSGAKMQIPAESLMHVLGTLSERPMAGDPQALFLAARRARKILYIADNAGEIIFDRILLNFFPIEKVTLAVRGHPILNDALREDAEIAGFTGLVPVIDNGSDAPGTVLEDCSQEFLDHFHASDLIISKGQGNYETLSSVRAPVFFLFVVKCPLVATQIGEPTGTMIVKESPVWLDSLKGKIRCI
jgi:damage-control phosphatase, subfamily I